MSRLPKLFVLGALAVTLFVISPGTAGATQYIFLLHDHPNGDQVPPTYGLRLDDLLSDGVYTFSFDYSDVSGSASMMLVYDDVAGTVNISGRAYGGRDIGGGYDPIEKGWVVIGFTYTTNVSQRDDCAGSPGDDVYVTGESGGNAGSVTLDGWGGNQVFNYTDKADGSGCTFLFDNDYDSKGNGTIAGDLSVYSGAGWVQPPTSGSRDWLFIGDMLTVPTESTTWGSLKSQWQD